MKQRISHPKYYSIFKQRFFRLACAKANTLWFKLSMVIRPQVNKYFDTLVISKKKYLKKELKVLG